MESYKESILEFNLFDLGFEGDNLLVFVCLAITATLTLYSAIKASERFWHYFGALAIATLLAVVGYWLRNALFEANIQSHQMLSGRAGFIQGDVYFAHLNFILQGMIGVFMMITALVVRRTRGFFQPS